MDYKIKQYQSFCGKFLRIKVEISQKILDCMDDSSKIELRSSCAEFEEVLHTLLTVYLDEVLDGENEQTSSENQPQTNEEIKPKKGGKPTENEF